MNLILQLPPDPNLAIQRTLGAVAGWDATAELLAGLVEVTDTTNRLLHKVWFKAPHPSPVTVNRPARAGGPSSRRKPVHPRSADFRRFFGLGPLTSDPTATPEE